MTKKRKVEIFSAACAVCETTVSRIRALACPSCELVVLDMNQAEVEARAKSLGIRSVPAVVIDGTLVDCCAGSGPDEEELKAARIGTPLS